MKSYTHKIVGILILFLMISCALESKIGLPNDEQIQAELIGGWYNESHPEERFTIRKNSENTYQILIHDEDKTDTFTSYSKTINGFNIMDIKVEDNNQITHVFYGFTLKDNTLIYSEVNDKLREEPFRSQTELIEFFETHSDSEEFFINPTEFKRNKTY